MNKHVLEIIRYGINGVVATTVHFAILTFNLQILAIPSAGIANLIAAMFGITCSFLGSYYFVFPRTGESIIRQAIKFSGLYSIIAFLHGLVLLLWTDLMSYDYRFGFLIATALQVMLSYMGNKFMVFKK